MVLLQFRLDHSVIESSCLTSIPGFRRVFSAQMRAILFIFPNSLLHSNFRNSPCITIFVLSIYRISASLRVRGYLSSLENCPPSLVQLPALRPCFQAHQQSKMNSKYRSKEDFSICHPSIPRYQRKGPVRYLPAAPAECKYSCTALRYATMTATISHFFLRFPKQTLIVKM